jgi:hypothetical protein
VSVCDYRTVHQGERRFCFQRVHRRFEKARIVEAVTVEEAHIFGSGDGEPSIARGANAAMLLPEDTNAGVGGKRRKG